MKTSIVNKIVTATIAIICGCAAAGCGPKPNDTAATVEHAPAFAAVSLAGDSVRLAQLHGKVVLLNIWATWCIPCRREIPELQALHQEYSARGLNVVGVSVDDAGARDDVAAFVRDFSMTYTVLLDPDDRVSELFRVPGVPASFLIDRDGVVRWRHLGAFKSTDAQFLKALQKTL